MDSAASTPDQSPMVSAASTPDQSSMASATPTPPPPARPFTMDLLERDAKFGFTWFVAQGGLTSKVKRGRYKKAIMTYDASAMWKELKSYMPHRDCDDPKAMYTVSKLTTLGAGIAKLMNFKLDYVIRDSLSVVELTKRRREKGIELTDQVDPDAVTLPDPLDQTFVPDLDLAPVGHGGRGEAEMLVPPLDGSSRHSPSEEEGEAAVGPPPRVKRRRAVAAAQPLSDTQVLRMLSEKAAELNLNPRANLMPDENLPPPPSRDVPFYPETMGEDAIAAAQATFLEQLNGTGGQGDDPQREDVTGDPTDHERATARAESALTPIPQPNIERRQARVRRRAEAAEQSSMELQPVVAVTFATPRTRRSRRLVFLDTEPTIQMASIQNHIRENQLEGSMANLEVLVKQTRFWPPSVIRRMGLDFMERSGRRIVGVRITEIIEEIKERMPIPNELREREIVRAEAPSENASASIVVVDPGEASGTGPATDIGTSRNEPSAATLPGDTRMEASATQSISMPPERPNVSPAAPRSPAEPGNAEESAVEISIVLSPGRGSDRGGNGYDNGNEVAPAEEKLLTFAELVPPGSQRSLAIRVFMGLLNNQKKGNVELIQNEWCGEIRIRILKPDYNPMEG